MAIVEVAVWQRVHPFAAALWKPVAAGAAAFAVMAALHTALPAGWLRLGGVIAGGVLGYAGLLLALGLPPEEKRIFDRITARLR
jgi:hypothetical protein